MAHALRGAEIGVAPGPGEVVNRHSTSGAPDPALQARGRATCIAGAGALSTNCELVVVAKTNDVLGIVRSARLEAKPSDNCSEHCFG
jgi:hypothetical protein